MQARSCPKAPQEMETGMRKLLVVIVVAFAAFYLFTEPQASADVVRNAVGVLGQGAKAVVTFLTALFH